MKIERISENQIKCTLTRSDLASRQMRLAELAYGSDKAKRLFQEMMQQAQLEVGFELDSSPVMIEAIPLSEESIVLIITKVDDPEELDARFSRFTQSDEDAPESREQTPAGADEILELFRKIRDAHLQARKTDAAEEQDAGSRRKNAPKEAPQDAEPAPALVQSFRFRSLDDVISAARGLNHFYGGTNTLYRSAGEEVSWQLVLHPDGCTPEDFNKVCNILSEYGTNEPFTAAGEAYLSEHGDALIRGRALQKLEEVGI